MPDRAPHDDVLEEPTGAPEDGEQEGNSGEPLDAHDQEEVRERTAPPAAVIYEAVYEEAAREMQRPAQALFWSGLAAGLSLGFSFVGQGLLVGMLPDAPWAPLVSSLGYTVGFLVVVLGRQQLFTENTLTPIIPLLRLKTGAALRCVLRLWAVVLVANIVGAFLFAWALSFTDLFADVWTPRIYAVLFETGDRFLALDPTSTFVGGVFAGWLLALMVWMLPYAATERVLVVLVITYLLGLGGFAHCVTGSIETMYAVLVSDATWRDYLGFFGPALLGNTVGGVALVAVLNHAQVVSGRNPRP